MARIRATLSTIILFGVASATNAEELLTNGDFSETMQLSGWTDSGSVTWDGSKDLQDQADSGSLRIDNSGAGFRYAFQCPPVRPGGSYMLSVWALVPSGQNVTQNPSAEGRLNWVDAPNCEGNFTAATMTEPASIFDGWELLSSPVVVAPPNAQSAHVQLESFSLDGDAVFVAYFDEASFVPEPSSHWLALGALVTLSRLATKRKVNRCGPPRRLVRSRLTPRA